MSQFLNISSQFSNRSNMIGVLASGLCLIHCLATPFIFVTKMCTDACCSDAPAYWKWIDYAFLIISFIAVYYSTKSSTNKIIKVLLWLSWFGLFFILINEQIQILNLSNYVIYLPAFALIGLHLYNRRFCECKEDTCCTND